VKESPGILNHRAAAAAFSPFAPRNDSSRRVVEGLASITTYRTRDMSTIFLTFGVRALWSVVSVYLLTVSVRILGLLYLTNKQKSGWFGH